LRYLNAGIHFIGQTGTIGWPTQLKSPSQDKS
jgi:hypothetical protein